MFVVRGVLLRITILCLGGVFGAFLSCVVRGVLLRITVLCGDGVFGASLSCRSWCIILCGDDTLEAVVLGGSLFCL